MSINACMVNKPKKSDRAVPLKLIHRYTRDEVEISILVDGLSNFYWKKMEEGPFALVNMPWKFQLPFYLTFLHNDELAARYKDLEIIDAIALFLREQYLAGN